MDKAMISGVKDISLLFQLSFYNRGFVILHSRMPAPQHGRSPMCEPKQETLSEKAFGSIKLRIESCMLGFRKSLN
jgi:hypothetical protein